MTQAVRQPNAPRSSTFLGVRPFRQWTLRSRVVLVVVVMLTVLAVVVGSVSVLALRSYLIDRLDQQVNSALFNGLRVVNTIDAGGPTVPDAGSAVTAPGQASGTLGAIRSANTGGLLADPVILSYRAQGSSRYPFAPKPVSIDGMALLTIPSDRVPRTVSLGAPLGDYRIAAAQLDNGDSIIIGLPMHEVQDTLRRLTFVIALVTLLAVLFAVLIGRNVVRFAIRPLQRVAGTAEQVARIPLDRGEVALSIRVPPEHTDPRTEVGKVGAALNKMLGHVAQALSARQASEQKVRQFVADASHELRTPLASIRGYAELTRRSPHTLPPDVTRSLDRIESEATRMTTLVEDLLLLARLDEGRELDHDTVDLSSLLIDAVSDAHAAGPDHEWVLNLPGEPVEVEGDGARLQQVLVNLLANARVHTPEGTTIVAALEFDTDSNTASVSVADNGPGISPSVQSTLFERFARGDSSRNRTTGSTGLGLAIVHAVVHAHKGTVEVRSEPGETVFTVKLPGSSSSGHTAAESSPAASEPDSAAAETP